MRFLVNLLQTVADKVHRDQARIADMRGNLMRTQKELKSAARARARGRRDAAVGAGPRHARQAHHAQPPRELSRRAAGRARSDLPDRECRSSPINDISRTHVTVTLAAASRPAVGTWLTGVAHLAGTEIPISGRVHRVVGQEGDDRARSDDRRVRRRARGLPHARAAPRHPLLAAIGRSARDRAAARSRRTRTRSSRSRRGGCGASGCEGRTRRRRPARCTRWHRRSSAPSRNCSTAAPMRTRSRP